MPETVHRAISAEMEVQQFREQLGSDKRPLIFLFGAGTSQAAGLDGIVALTENVGALLTGPVQAHYRRLLSDAAGDRTVEDILDDVRLCRELMSSNPSRGALGLQGDEPIELDRAICQAIRRRVSLEPPHGLDAHITFATWSRAIRRDHSIEIFTTNYDLLLERALERTETPHFDGFVGSVEPQFVASTVDPDSKRLGVRDAPPANWVRVWKLHGSVNWQRVAAPGAQARIIRCAPTSESTSEDLLIFPAREKYSDSRRFPFLAFQDRLRTCLASGERLLVVSGYSFRDQHINEILFDGLRANNRLAVSALLFDGLDAQPRELLAHAALLTNLKLYAPDGICVGGQRLPWASPAGTDAQTYWATDTGTFALGDFRRFVAFLQSAFNLEAASVPVSAPAPPLQP